MLPVDCIIFDLDGTIVDTEPVAVEIMRTYLGELGVKAKDEHIKLITGRKWEVVSQFIETNYQLPCSMAEFEKVVLKRYHDRICEGVPSVSGVVETVKELSKTVPLGLVSGSHRKDVLANLEALKIKSHFTHILGAEDYKRSKPDPEGFVKAMGLLGANPRRTLIFEDSTAGIESAHAANAWVVAITDTNHYEQDQTKAHHHINNFIGIDMDWVKSKPWEIP